MKTWSELKQSGSAHYRGDMKGVNVSQPIDIYKAKGVFKNLAEELKTKEIPAWLSLNKEKLESKTVGEPSLDEVKPPAEISLIFEFYSR